MERSFRAFVLLPVILLCACVSLAEKDIAARHAFNDGDFPESVELLDGALGPDSAGKDSLLFLLQRGIILHTAGKYAESNEYLLEAVRQAEALDIVRFSEEAGTFLTNERFREYRPYDHERVLIYAYLAMNYALLGKTDDALVECRRMQLELFSIKQDRGEDFKPNPFALYLSALLYESMGMINDSYIDYKALYAVAPDYPYLKEDLLRTSKIMNFHDEYAEWAKKFKREALKEDPQSGEVIIFFQCGQSPVKQPHHEIAIIPEYVRRHSSTDHGEVRVEGGKVMATTFKLFDVEAAAIEELRSRSAALLLKRAAIIAAKEVGVRIAERGMKDDYGKTTAGIIGIILRIFFYSMEEPDLRSWETLPANLQIARFPLKAGTYDLNVRFIGAGGAVVGSATIQDVTVTAGGRTFLNLRAMK